MVDNLYYILMGPPGAGKTTVANSFINMEGNSVGVVKFGDYLRSLCEEDFEFKRIHDSYTERGEVLPDEFIMDHYFMICKKKSQMHQKVLIEGFPKTISQILALNSSGLNTCFIFLGTDDTTVFEQRIQERSLLSNRLDDRSTEIIKKRIGVYLNFIENAEDYICTDSIIRVDCSMDAEQVIKTVQNIVLS